MLQLFPTLITEMKDFALHLHVDKSNIKVIWGHKYIVTW